MVQEGRGVLTQLRSACNHYSEITTLFDTLFLFSTFKAAGYTSGAMASGTGYVMARVGCDWRIFSK